LPSEANEHDFEFDILDATKIWLEELVPLQVIGEFVLNRVVDEFSRRLSKLHLAQGIL